MIYALLIYEFFKIGLFSFGGGYATIPFLYNLSEIYGWYSIPELSKMTAVASITPGPVGINVATYAGYKVAGIFGALCGTVSEVFPSLILVILISKLLKKFHENIYVNAVIDSLKPTSCALLIYVTFSMAKSIHFNMKILLLFIILLVLGFKKKPSPIFYFAVSAVYGVLMAII